MSENSEPSLFDQLKPGMMLKKIQSPLAFALPRVVEISDSNATHAFGNFKQGYPVVLTRQEVNDFYEVKA